MYHYISSRSAPFLSLTFLATLVVAGIALSRKGSSVPVATPPRNDTSALTSHAESFKATTLGENWTDRWGDGFPDAARLDQEKDRESFVRWVTYLAEAQYYQPSVGAQNEIDDCAALVRFASGEQAPLLIQIERSDAFPVLLFGNGHVGRALVNVLGVVPARVRWIDSRADDFPRVVASNVRIVVTETPEDELLHAPSGAFVVVTTHSHALDFTLIAEALARDDWRYLGLIGSKSKRAQFERRLAARGFSAEASARIRCPIGTEGVALKAKHPGAIAVAIAAELLFVREAMARSADASRGVATLRH